MKVFNDKKDLINEILLLKSENKTIGFVPTMGALHAGHLSLIKQCKLNSDICVASIFVNPTQFNNQDDFINYPKTLDNDLSLLDKEKCDIVFTPTKEGIYNNNDSFDYTAGDIENVLEGKFRPGHFKGVMQVVKLLFDIVQPNFAFFGDKDFQQLSIIRKMVKDMQIPVKIVGCELIREPDGLAMSSRNMRLTNLEKESALLISKALFEIKENIDKRPIDLLIGEQIAKLNSDLNLKVEYLNLVNREDLSISANYNPGNQLLCTAVYCGNVRLIDNIKL